MLLTELDTNFALPAINIIKERWPDMWRDLSTVEPSREIVFQSYGAHPAFVFNGRQLASSYDPEDEAELQTHAIPQHATSAWVYGVGVGYLPRHLLATRPDLQRLNVVILNKSLFLGMLHHVDQSDWISDDRVSLYLALQENVPRIPSAITSPCLWLSDADGSLLSKRLIDEVNIEAYARAQWTKRQKILQQQLDENATLLATDADAAELTSEPLATCCSSAVVVGAGPSLDSVIEIVRDKVANGMLLICVDAAIKTLLAANLVPDVIVTVDPNRDGILPYFDCDLAKLEKSALVYFPVVHNDVLKIWPYKRYVAYGEPSEFYDELCQRVPRLRLYSSGTVAHPAIDLAVKMGMKRVYFAGIDFAYVGGKSHADNVNHKLTLDDREDVTMVYSGRDEKVATTLSMVGYLRALEAYIERSHDVVYVNLSREGAFVQGTQYDE